MFILRFDISRMRNPSWPSLNRSRQVTVRDQSQPLHLSSVRCQIIMCAGRSRPPLLMFVRRRIIRHIYRCGFSPVVLLREVW